MPSLQLVKAGTGQVNIADAGAVKKLFSIATNPDAALYFHKQFQHQAQAVGLSEEFQSVVDEIKTFVDIVRAETPQDSNFWSGKLVDTVMTKFRNFQTSLSDSAAAVLKTNATLTTEGIRFDFDMDKNANLLQVASTAKGDELPNDVVAQINILYSDWLTKNGMMCSDGVIYHSHDGEVDKSKRADPDAYRKLFKGEQQGAQGFAAFVKEKTQLDVQVVDRSEAPEQAQQART